MNTNYLTTAKIQNFKIFKDIEISFTQNINILLGNNGLGKTSILQAITFGLLPIENEDKTEGFRDFISFNNDKAAIKLNWGENKNRKIFIHAKGRPVEEQLNVPQLLLLAYGVNLNTNREQDHSKIIKLLINGENESYFTKSIFEDNYNRLHDPIIILQDLSREFDITKNQVIKQILEIYLNTINSFLDLIDGNEKIKIECETIEYFYRDLNHNKLKTNNLSEGYRDHILLISDILIRIITGRNLIFANEKDLKINELFVKAKGIILIDEFDRHLHPIWQRKLLSKFKTDLPNIQFILTTHNPFSVQSAVGANAIQLLIINNKLIAKNSIIQSKNLLSIVREYFTKDLFDFETQNLLKQFSELLDKIDDGEIEIVYSLEFKNIVKQIYDKGAELQAIIASQLLQLNSSLKKINKTEFEL